MAALAVLAASQLSFLSPAIVPDGLETLKYSLNQRVNVSWFTPYDLTDLEVWQGSDDGSWAVDVLAANMTKNETTYTWQAMALPGLNLSLPFHFRLQKSDEPNSCERCAADSLDFRVASPRASMTSSSSTSHPTISSSTPAAIAAESTSSSPSPVATRSGISQGAKLGIGLGVGLGVAFLIALIAAILLLLRRRQKERQQVQEIEEKRQRDEAFAAATAAGMAAKARFSSGNHSWMTGTSNTKSYIEPFDFEAPAGWVKEGSESLFGRHDGSIEQARLVPRPATPSPLTGRHPGW